jgi:hypothetical protein
MWKYKIASAQNSTNYRNLEDTEMQKITPYLDRDVWNRGDQSSSSDGTP